MALSGRTLISTCASITSTFARQLHSHNFNYRQFLGAHERAVLGYQAAPQYRAPGGREGVGKLTTNALLGPRYFVASQPSVGYRLYVDFRMSHKLNRTLLACIIVLSVLWLTVTH